jgi:cell surface protein SprA
VLCVAAIPAAARAQDPDSTLQFPIVNPLDPTTNVPQSFDLGDPSNVKQTIVFDPVSGKYVFTETLGQSGINYRNPSMMTLEEYLEYERQKSMKENWKDKIDQQTEEDRALEFPIKIPGKTFENFFGSDEITIRPQGSLELSFGVNSSRYDNPILPVKQRRVTRFDFQQQIQLNLVGQIGTKLKLNTSYNTQAAFDFDNITKLGYSGDEDQIMQRIELGNVSMPSTSSLIPGSQTLFGAYTKMRFGRLTVDAIAASSKGKRQEINITGKAQVLPFEMSADNYEANRHYFINQFFEESYDNAMSQLPIVASEVMITRMEVWMTNRINNTDNTRNIIAFTDLGESKPDNIEGNPGALSSLVNPDNSSNGLYGWAVNQPNVRNFNGAVPTLNNTVVAPGPFQQAIHYEKVENARKLSESEYTYNSLLGYISLNQPLNNDEVLAVSYEYTYRGQTYQVGEFSNDGVVGSQALYLKLLKPTITNPTITLWNLMMKNVYSIGAYQVDKEGFRFDILYNNPETSVPVPFLPQPGVDDRQIITLVGMDTLNINNQRFSDGVFDFVPIIYNGNKAETGGTINTRNGRIYFSTVEPFGQTLATSLAEAGIDPQTIDRVAFRELYDSTKTAAQQIPAKNRFSFKGQYQSSISSDIPLNALNVPEGAVTVTAGGIKLVEGVDFTVDYNLGRVKILNTGILESNTPIKISIESNSVFGFQAKSLIGTHLNYRFSENFNLGATWMRMMERPVTQKVDIGSEPYKNNVLGLDVNYRTELPWLTKAIDFLPIISTKEKSFLTFQGEGAHLIPGTPRAISKSGISYVDDFEGSQSTIDLKQQSAWHIASTPQGQNDLFPEGPLKTLAAGYKRSKVAWYLIDPIFYSSNQYTPDHIANDPTITTDSRYRPIQQTDIFPNLQPAYGTIRQIYPLELSFYPAERGMYNYDTQNVNEDGTFSDPEDRWGGIQRALTTNDFEVANVQYIQFWMLDPFNDDALAANGGAMSGGDLYFNLGNISEDVLADSRKEFENGLPADGSSINTDTTSWARVSTQQVVVNAFDNEPSSRDNQDLGLDGFNNDGERAWFADFVTWAQGSALSQEAKDKLINDPSSDDYIFYLDDAYDAPAANILDRYKQYNNHQGNSPVQGSPGSTNSKGLTTMATVMPDMEDINQDNNLGESEAYFQYKVSLRQNDMAVGENFITSVQEFTIGTKVERWYQFKIPIHEPERVIGGIRDFRSIRFMRMFMRGFPQPMNLRFAKLELIRGEWRPYLLSMEESGESTQPDPNLTDFNIAAVNVEENDQRKPVKYEIPPGILREIDPSQPQQRQMNEQSLSLDVCALRDGDARAAYKNVTFDVRTYKKLKMFIHGEETLPGTVNDKDVTVFVRLGTDFVDNYYEYELPLYLTPWQTTSPEGIWPEKNDMEIVFDDLLRMKMARNDQGIPITTEYVITDPANAERRLKIKGNPNLQAMKVIMIGIRNPSSNTPSPWADDGLAKCVQVWANELRLTDFVDQGGSAAVAQMQVQAADFANVTVSGSYSGINWGAVDSRVQERQRNERMTFDFQSTVQLGQFLGRSARVSVPFFYGYSWGVINPEYDPFNPDIKLKSYDRAIRRERQRLGQDFTERRSYNFQGVRKERKEGAKPHFFDISNFTLSYGYNELLHRDFNTNYDRTKTWTGNLTYAYSFSNKPLEPFKKVKFMEKSKWWAIVRDASFNPIPKNIGFTNDIVRSYNERQIRNNLVPDYEFRPVYVKNFIWNRGYNLGWDFTKNLKLTFTAANRAIFDEGNGRVDRKSDPESYRVFRDTVFDQLSTLGKTLDYTHSYNLSYTLPLDKIPALDWVSANAKYGGTYNWQRAALGQESYGNIVQNSRTINGQVQANFVTLYNKVPYFKKVLGGGKNPRTRASAVSSGRDNGGGKKPAADATADNEPPLVEPVPEKPVEEMTKQELRKWKKVLRKYEREKKRRERRKKRKDKVNPVAGFATRLLMTVRNVSATYNQTDGTLLPGYNQNSSVLGYNPSFSSGLTGFIFGKQSYSVTGRENGYDFARTASGNGWLVENSLLNRYHTITHMQTFTGRGTLEPIKDLTIDLSMNRTFGENVSDFYRFNDVSQQFESQSRMTTNTLTYSTISIGTAFVKQGKDYSSDNFTQLLNNRQATSQLLGGRNANSNGFSSTGFANGYSASQQDVVIGAFMSAYTKSEVNERSTNPFRTIPLPNWTINYNGLTKFDFMKKYVKNFVIRHGYSSTVNLSGVQSNLKAAFDDNGDVTSRDLNNNFYASNTILNVTITERFSPLIGFDATWNVNSQGQPQGLITKFEIKRDRSATLSLASNQVTEVLGNEMVVGLGYKFSKVRLPIKMKGKDAESPLNMRFDFTFRDNLTVIRDVDKVTNQATAGQRVVSIKSTIDYNLTTNLIVAFYYDQVLTTPKIATSYPTGNLSTGLRLRFNLGGL